MSGNPEAFPVCVCVSLTPFQNVQLRHALRLLFQILFPKEKLESFWLPLKGMMGRKKHTLKSMSS